MRKIFIMAICMLLLSCGISAFAAKDAVKVGAALNLTGPMSSWGQLHLQGQQDYFKYVNEVKDGIGGRQLELIKVDTAYQIPKAISAIKRFCTRDKVDMIATWSTGEGLAVKPIVRKYKTPAINYSTGQDLLNPPIDYMYLPFGSYILDSYAVMQYIKKIHKGSEPPKVGLITLNNAYGKSIHEPSKEFAKKHNIEIVDIEEFPPKTLDLSVEMQRLKKKGAEYVYGQILPSGWVTALKEVDRIDNYDPVFLGTWTATDNDFFKSVKGTNLIRDRLYMQSCAGLPQDNTPGVKLMQELIEKYGTVDRYDLAYWEGVVIGRIIERALVKAGEMFDEINPENVNKALESFDSEDFGGLFPDVSYSKNDHEASFTGRIIQVHGDGTFTPKTNFFVPGQEEIELIGCE